MYTKNHATMKKIASKTLKWPTGRNFVKSSEVITVSTELPQNYHTAVTTVTTALPHGYHSISHGTTTIATVTTTLPRNYHVAVILW